MKKSKNIVCYSLIAAALFVLLSPSSLADNLVISGDQITTIDSDYTQVGDILIQDSGTLVVKNGATLTANGYSVTVKGKGALKIENGVLKANKLSLYDDSNLDMAQNSKLELDKFVSNNQTSIRIKNAKISTNIFNTTGNQIDISSGEIISYSSVSFNVQSFSISNSKIKGSPVLIESPSAVSIESSVLDSMSYIICPSLYVSNSNIKGTSLKINCTSQIAITNSTISDVSAINSPDVSVSNSKIGGLLLIDSSKVFISKSEIEILSIKANEFSVSDKSKILGVASLKISSFNISISNSDISGVSSIKAEDFSVSNDSKILGTISLFINSSRINIFQSEIYSNSGDVNKYGKTEHSSISIASKSNILISDSKIISGNGINGKEFSAPCKYGSNCIYGGHGGGSSLFITSENNVWISNSIISAGSGGNGHGSGNNGGNGGDSSLSISTKSQLSVSNSQIKGGNGGGGGYGFGDHGGGNGGDSFFSIISEYNLSISNSEIMSGYGGNGGNGRHMGDDGHYGGNGGDSSLSIASDAHLLISNSEIKSGYGGSGGDAWYDGNWGSSFFLINFQQLYAADANFNRPIDNIKNNSIAYLTNTNLLSFNVKDNAVIYKYPYLTVNITDKLGNPISNAKFDVLYYLNETIYKSETTDSNGTAKIPVLSDIITAEGDQFVGNYKVVAYYQNHITPKNGVEMKSNQKVTLNFSDLAVKPRPTLRISTDNLTGSIDLQTLISNAQASIKDAKQIFADTSEAEGLLQQAQEYSAKNELPYANEFAFRAKESAENAKDIRIKEYFGGFIMLLIIGLIVYKRKHK